jgi:hypothetical protein
LAAFHLAGPLAEAIRYALARWPALTRFLDDGRIELDNNPIERAIRPIALGRKNHLTGWRRSADRTRLHGNSLLTGNFTGNFALLGLSDRIS